MASVEACGCILLQLTIYFSANTNTGLECISVVATIAGAQQCSADQNGRNWRSALSLDFLNNQNITNSLLYKTQLLFSVVIVVIIIRNKQVVLVQKPGKPFGHHCTCQDKGGGHHGDPE